MKKLVVLTFLVGWLLAISGCASDTATSQPEKKQAGWGTVNTIESEGVRR